METLYENELRAVLAHEIGHLKNGDSNTAIHLVAINMGFYAAFRWGMQMLQRARRNNEKGNKDPNAILAPVLLGVS